MTAAKKRLRAAAILLVVAALGFTSFVGWRLYPHADPQPLPAILVDATTPLGLALLEGAEARVDYDALEHNFEPQVTISYCGVATGTVVLEALGKPSSQWDFFTDAASAARSRLAVTFGGMSLVDLGGLLTAHGLQAVVTHASDSSEAQFRKVIERNLSTHGDFLVVNYQRDVLGQGRVGHISPVAAYDADTDQVLIMDTAAHKYPPTWVPVSLLFDAMNTVDRSTGRTRGYLEVANP